MSASGDFRESARPSYDMSRALASLGARLDSTLRLLSAVSNLTAVPIRSKRLSQAAQEILKVLVRSVDSIEGSSILFYDPDLAVLRLVAAWGREDLLGSGEGPHNQGLTFKPGEGIAGQVFAERRPLFWTKGVSPPGLMREDARLLTNPEALACLPLNCLGRTLGVLNLSFAEPLLLNDTRQRELKFLAQVAANVLETFVQKLELDNYATALAGQVARSERQYQRLFESAILGILRFTPEGGLISVNPACARIFGYASPEEMVRLVASHKTPLFDDPAKGRQVVKLLAQGQGPLALENLYRRKNGEVFPAVFHGRAVRDLRGNLMGVEGFLEDISSRRKAEEDKGALEEQLARLRRAQKLGMMAEGLIGDLAGLLEAIRVHAQEVKQTLEPAHPGRGRLEETLLACQKAGELLCQAQGVAEREAADFTRIELAPLVREALRRMRPALPARLTLDFSACAEPCLVSADAARLWELVAGLATNALRSMWGEGGRLVLTLTRAAQGGGETPLPGGSAAGGYCRLGFRGDGPGLSPASLARVFEPPVAAGSGGPEGIGLAVAREIVARHQGSLVINAGPEEGARLDICLPCVPAEPAGEPPAPAGEGAGPRVLLVDPTPDLLDVARRHLEAGGYLVNACRNGREALAALRRDPAGVDLVVCACDLPDLDGGRLAQEIKWLRPDLPIVACVGFSTILSEDEAASQGFDSVLTKPLGMAELLAAAQRVLAAAGSWPEPGVPA